MEEGVVCEEGGGVDCGVVDFGDVEEVEDWGLLEGVGSKVGDWMSGRTAVGIEECRLSRIKCGID